MISLVFLVLILAYRPYCTDGLNQLQAGCLLVNVFTLFVGIMLIITTQLEDAAKRAEEEFDGSERDAISVIVFIANLFTILLPMLQEMPRSKVDATSCLSKALVNRLDAPCTSLDQGPAARIDLSSQNAGWDPAQTGRFSRASLTQLFPRPQLRQPEARVINKAPPVPDYEITAAAMPVRLVSSHVDRPRAKQSNEASEERDPDQSGRYPQATLTHQYDPPPGRPAQPEARVINKAPPVPDYGITAAAMPSSLVSSHVDRPRTKQSNAASEDIRDPAPSGCHSRAPLTQELVPPCQPQPVAKVIDVTFAVTDYEITAASPHVDRPRTKQSKATSASEERDPAPSGRYPLASLTHTFVPSRPPATRRLKTVARVIDMVPPVPDYEITAAAMPSRLVSPHVDRPRTKQSEAASMVGDICWARQPPQ
jgi:hypothetical protein